jgi:hypothetical protein
MTSRTGRDVPRPLRKNEYRLRFASREAERGWADLIATARNAAAMAWEFLASHPLARDAQRCYPLAGELGTVKINGADRERWPYKPTSGGRIWYAVEPANGTERGIVWLTRVFTGHPNETVKNHR